MTVRKVTFRGGRPLQPLNDLNQGDAFQHDGVVYLKTDETSGERLRCTCLTGDVGYLQHLDRSQGVEPVDIEIEVIRGGGQ